MKTCLFLIIFFASSFEGETPEESKSPDKPEELKNPDKPKEPKKSGEAFLLFACLQDIRKIPLSESKSTIIRNTTGAAAIDFDYGTGMMFWSDNRKKKVYKAPIDGNDEASVVYEHSLLQIKGLAVDWIYSNIYWINARQKTIEVANFNGEKKHVLIQDDLKLPLAIALVPQEAWMFWTDSDASKIEKAGMDGSNRKILIKTKIKIPLGLTVDLDKKLLYWTDFELQEISSCDYNGGNQKQVVQLDKKFAKPSYGIATFKDWLYWGERSKFALYKAKTSGGDSQLYSSIESQYRWPLGMQVYHSSKQPSGKNHCQSANCSYLCLPAPKLNSTSPNFSCVCPNDNALMSDCAPKGSAAEEKVPTEKKVEATAEKKIEVPTEKKVEVPTEKKVEVPTEKKVEVPTEKKVEVPAEKKVEVPTEKKVEVPTEKKDEVLTEKKVEATAEKKVEVPTEKKDEVPTEKKVEVTAEKKVEVPTEKKDEVPTEKQLEHLQLTYFDF